MAGVSAAFFVELDRVFQEARRRLKEAGYPKVTKWDCLPAGEWPLGWENCRALQVFGHAPDGSFKRVELEVDARRFVRPVRRVKRFTGPGDPAPP